MRFLVFLRSCHGMSHAKAVPILKLNAVLDGPVQNINVMGA